MSIACLPSELWHRVIRHLTIMEDTCSLAMVSKYFYKLVEMDFKRECRNHVVYRLKGETWAYAFSNLGSRSYNTIIAKIEFYRDNAICCPFTGKIALALNDAYVLLTNIDFGLSEFTILDFSSYTNKVTRVNMINRGTELLVHSVTFVLVYDLVWMQVKIPPYDSPQNKGYQTVQSDTVLDLYTKKEYKICAKKPNGIVSYLNMYDKSKYFAVHTIDNQLAIYDAETGKGSVICAWTHDLSVFVINDNDSVVVTGYRFGILIYSMKKRRIVFCNPNDDGWFMFNSNVLIHIFNSSFLVYNNQTEDWEIVQSDPSLQLNKKYYCYCHGRFVPMCDYKVMTSYQNDVFKRVYLQFEKGRVRFKTFNAEMKRHLTYQDSWVEARNDNYPIWKLSRMKFTVLGEACNYFSEWSAQFCTEEIKIQLVNAYSGFTVYY